MLQYPRTFPNFSEDPVLFEFCVAKDYIDLLQRLMEAGIQNFEFTMLNACKYGRKNVFKWCLNNCHTTPLFFMNLEFKKNAIKANNHQILEELFKLTKLPNRSTSFSELIHLAIDVNSLSCLKVLLKFTLKFPPLTEEQKTNICTKIFRNDNKTELLTIIQKDSRFKEFLTKRVEITDKQYFAPLITVAIPDSITQGGIQRYCISYDFADLLKQLLAIFPIQQLDFHSLLDYACGQNKTECFGLLVSELKAEDISLDTLLYIFMFDRSEMLSIIINKLGENFTIYHFRDFLKRTIVNLSFKCFDNLIAREDILNLLDDDCINTIIEKSIMTDRIEFFSQLYSCEKLKKHIKPSWITKRQLPNITKFLYDKGHLILLRVGM